MRRDEKRDNRDRLGWRLFQNFTASPEGWLWMKYQAFVSTSTWAGNLAIRRFSEVFAERSENCPDFAALGGEASTAAAV